MKHLTIKNIATANKGFTLIELLIVIAILGILTTAVLVAINPLEQFARGRDAGRKNLVNSLGHAAQSYYTAQSANYPAENATWMNTLQTNQEIKIVPENLAANGNPDANCAATAANQNNICYDSNGTEAVVYARQGSQSEALRAGGGGAACALANTYVVWSSAVGRTGLFCSATPPAAGETNLVY